MASGSTESSTAPMDDVASAFLSLISPEESTPSRETPGQDSNQEAQATSETDVSEQSEEEGSDAETDEQTEEQSEEPQTFTVKIDGKEEKVTLDELMKGYSRTGDYTRKTQKLGEDRKAVEAERQRATEVVQSYAERLKAVEEALAEAVPKEPDWNKLRKENPEEFAATWAEFDQATKRREAVKAEREKAEQLLAQEYSKKQQEFLATEREKLLEKIPEWKDPAKARAEAEKLTAFATGVAGFSAEDIAGITDHRAIMVLRMAMQLHEARTKTQVPAGQTKRPAAMRPGTVATGPGKANEITRAAERLAKSGRVEDAAKLFEHIL